MVIDYLAMGLFSRKRIPNLNPLRDEVLLELRGLIADFADVDGIGRDISVVRTGFRTDGKPMKVTTPPPALGQDNEHLLHELGYDKVAIERLRTEGVI